MTILLVSQRGTRLVPLALGPPNTFESKPMAEGDGVVMFSMQ